MDNFHLISIHIMKYIPDRIRFLVWQFDIYNIPFNLFLFLLMHIAFVVIHTFCVRFVFLVLCPCAFVCIHYIYIIIHLCLHVIHVSCLFFSCPYHMSSFLYIYCGLHMQQPLLPCGYHLISNIIIIVCLNISHLPFVCQPCLFIYCSIHYMWDLGQTVSLFQFGVVVVDLLPSFVQHAFAIYSPMLGIDLCLTPFILSSVFHRLPSAAFAFYLFVLCTCARHCAHFVRGSISSSWMSVARCGIRWLFILTSCWESLTTLFALMTMTCVRVSSIFADGVVATCTLCRCYVMS